VKVGIILEQVSLNRSQRPIHPEINNLKMVDAVDIGRMKLLTNGTRGSKDFVDIFCLTISAPNYVIGELFEKKDKIMRCSALSEPEIYDLFYRILGRIKFVKCERGVWHVRLWSGNSREQRQYGNLLSTRRIVGFLVTC